MASLEPFSFNGEIRTRAAFKKLIFRLDSLCLLMMLMQSVVLTAPTGLPRTRMWPAGAAVKARACAFVSMDGCHRPISQQSAD